MQALVREGAMQPEQALLLPCVVSQIQARRDSFPPLYRNGRKPGINLPSIPVTSKVVGAAGLLPRGWNTICEPDTWPRWPHCRGLYGSIGVPGTASCVCGLLLLLLLPFAHGVGEGGG